jgi:glycosyltransferase involved in cell wall biosynthesis
MSKKVVHLTSVHVPYDTRIFHRECKSLAEADYKVVLIAQNEINETVNGVTIHAIPPINGKIKRLFKGIKNVYFAALKHPDASLFHFHDPELIPVGLLLKIKGFRVIYDVHEYVPLQILIKDWIPDFFKKPLSRLVAFWEKWASNKFDHVIVTVPAIKERFQIEHCTMIRNFPEVRDFNSKNIIPYKLRPLQVTYIGEITIVYGAVEMVEAAGMVSSKYDLTMVLGGRISPEELKIKLQNLPGWKHVDYQGWVHRPEFEKIMGLSRLGLINLKLSPNHLIAYPTKLLEYLMYGLPVVSSDIPFCREIIEKTNCGILIDSDNPQNIAEAITWIFEHPEEAGKMGKRGQEYVLKYLTWNTEKEQLFKVYKKVLAE